MNTSHIHAVVLFHQLHDPPVIGMVHVALMTVLKKTIQYCTLASIPVLNLLKDTPLRSGQAPARAGAEPSTGGTD
jgi:hypothetical protein